MNSQECIVNMMSKKDIEQFIQSVYFNEENLLSFLKQFQNLNISYKEFVEFDTYNIFNIDKNEFNLDDFFSYIRYKLTDILDILNQRELFEKESFNKRLLLTLGYVIFLFGVITINREGVVVETYLPYENTGDSYLLIKEKESKEYLGIREKKDLVLREDGQAPFFLVTFKKIKIV